MTVTSEGHLDAHGQISQPPLDSTKQKEAIDIDVAHDAVVPSSADAYPYGLRLTLIVSSIMSCIFLMALDQVCILPCILVLLLMSPRFSRPF
jgi:hypothetical protein